MIVFDPKGHWPRGEEYFVVVLNNKKVTEGYLWWVQTPWKNGDVWVKFAKSTESFRTLDKLIAPTGFVNVPFGNVLHLYSKEEWQQKKLGTST